MRTQHTQDPAPPSTTVDLDRKGKQAGFLMIPHFHDDAWGVTRIPLAVIANGPARRSSWRVAIMAMNMKARSPSRNSSAISTPARFRAD